MTERVTVVETPAYLARAEKIMTEAERIEAVDAISASPLIGSLVKGGKGLRKLRIGLEGRGKRGGGRIVYWFYSQSYPVVLLWAFAKNDASDLTAEQHERIASMIAGLLDDFGVRK